MSNVQLARLGDIIETVVRIPRPEVLRLQLNTPEACAHANELLMQPGCLWILVRQLETDVVN